MKKKSYIRKETYSIEEVLPFIGKHKKDYDGDLIKMDSQRYELFSKKGCKCVVCGLEGKYFAKERDRKCQTYHFNLYGINEQGEEIMLTKDHIIPKSKGGANHISNYQTMCIVCNYAKGNKI